MRKRMEMDSRDGGETEASEGVGVILERIEKKVNAIADLVIRLERVLGNVPSTVCEPKSAYQAEVQKETTLMADYILDEAGRVTNIQFNLVRKL